MYRSQDQLILFDADGTTIDAFTAIGTAFARNGMDIGDLARFQKRRKLLKYLGGLREVPTNLKKQFGKHSRKRLLSSLTEVYREEAALYPGIAELLRELIASPCIRVGMVTRNITHEPDTTLRLLFRRHDIDIDDLDFFACISLREDKTDQFRKARRHFDINPARAYACGDEYRDFQAAQASGLHPFIVSYGFEDHERLTRDFKIPVELVSSTPDELCMRIRHTFALPPHGKIAA